jgi:hypothetical protein
MNLSFWSALLGVIGAFLIFIFGLPPKIDPGGQQYLITGSIDEKEKKKGKKYKKIGKLGLALIVVSYSLQILSSLSE